MTTFEKTFTPRTYVGVTAPFNIGDANDHTFIVTVSTVDTSVDFNLQTSIDGTNWADLNSSDIQKSANGSFLYNYTGIHSMLVRGAYTAQVGGTAATATVGTVVFTAVEVSPEFNVYTVETALGVDAGSETVEVDGNNILITGNVASTIGQIQTAIAGNAEAAALITADSITTFDADGPTSLAGGDSAQLLIQYKGGE